MIRKSSKARNTSIRNFVSNRTVLIVIFAIILGAVIVTLNARNMVQKTRNNQYSYTVKTTEKENLLFKTFQHELENLHDPFATFSIPSQKPNSAGVCQEIEGMEKTPTGNIRTRYKDVKRCDITQSGSIVMSSAQNQVAIARILKQINIDELFFKNGWQYDNRFASRQKTTNETISYILNNVDSILQQLNSEGVQPESLNGTVYSKKIDDKTSCSFSVNHDAGAEETIHDPEVVNWDRIILSFSMTCSYDNS